MALDGIISAIGLQRNYKRLGVAGSVGHGHLFLNPLAAEPSAAAAEGRVYFDGVAEGLKQNDGTQFRALSDRHIIRERLTATELTHWLFIADRPYKILSFHEIHSVVGGTGAVLRPRKVLAAATDAPSAAAGANVIELTAANVGLETTVNVTQSPAVVTTAGANLLAVGDKVGFSVGGTLTGILGVFEMIIEQV